MKKSTWRIAGISAVVLLVGSFIYSNSAANKANEGVSFSENVKGNSEAVVVLTEYSDFQCPACGQTFPVVQDIMAQYGDRLRFEYKHFPLISIHPYAVPAAIAAEAAGQQDKFFEMHDKLFENQSTWSASSNPQAYFIRYAEEIGLDVVQFKTHLGSSLIKDRVMEGYSEARSLGLTGTPTFLLNGERVQYQSFDELITLIETAIGVQPEDASATSLN